MLLQRVKDKMIISDGYNGTPTGFENTCEDDENYTKWYVLHAEANAIMKVASSTIWSETVFKHRRTLEPENAFNLLCDPPGCVAGFSGAQ